jgi:hypothetical protein
MNIKTKIAAVLVAAAFVVPGISLAQTTTPTIASLEAEIQSLLAELNTLETQVGQKAPAPSTGPSPITLTPVTSTVQGKSGGSAFGSAEGWCFEFGSNLGPGSTGSGVTALQEALQAKGVSVNVTGNYDPQTVAAVTSFQNEYPSQILTPNGLQSGTGYAGKSTREELNTLVGCGGPIEGPVQGPITISGPTPGVPPCIIAPGSNIACRIPSAPVMPTPTSTVCGGSTGSACPPWGGNPPTNGTGTLPVPPLPCGGGITNGNCVPVPAPTSTSPVACSMIVPYCPYGSYSVVVNGCSEVFCNGAPGTTTTPVSVSQ